MGRTVLVTGVSRYLGARTARMLSADPHVDLVVGVDVVPPPFDIGSARFVRADLRTPAIQTIVATHDIDTVLHAGVLQTPLSAGGRAAMKEINVLGTMQLVAACQRVPSVRRIVVKGSTAVYGSSASAPAMFVETDDANASPRGDFSRDSFDVEDAVRGLARRRSDVSVAVLRLANVIGPRITTPVTRYFALPVVPTVLGFDARLQFLHEDDAVAAMHHAVITDAKGAFNVAGDGVLSLSAAVAKVRRVPLPLPGILSSITGTFLGRNGLVEFAPENADFLKFGRVVDTTRMREVLGFSPRFTTSQAFDVLADRLGAGMLDDERLDEVEGVARVTAESVLRVVKP
jgi:UDP-glucose 4-epimerase